MATPIILPPRLLTSDFARLRGSKKPEVEAHFRPLVSELQAFLNNSEPLQRVQRVRGKRPRGRAFVRPARVESHHWWFSHDGGRNEAQWNLGMFPCHLRFGIGFNASGGGYGKPAEVEDAFNRFLKALRKAKQQRPGVRFEVETFDPVDKLKVFPVEELLDGLPRTIRHWLFVGRILRSGLQSEDGTLSECGEGDDSEILSNPDLFASELTQMAHALWPMWEQSRKLI